MSELWRKGAVELAAMIRDREVSSREVVQAVKAAPVPADSAPPQPDSMPTWSSQSISKSCPGYLLMPRISPPLLQNKTRRAKSVLS